MRFILGIIIGCVLTIGGAYVADRVSAADAKPATALGFVLFGPEPYRRSVALVSLVYPVMYLALSAYVTFSRKR